MSLKWKSDQPDENDHVVLYCKVLYILANTFPKKKSFTADDRYQFNFFGPFLQQHYYKWFIDR